MYTVREFRASLKEAFDLAKDGRTVIIDRQGDVFALELLSPRMCLSEEDWKPQMSTVSSPPTPPLVEPQVVPLDD